MNIKTVIHRKYMNYENYIKLPMQMVQLNLNMVIFKTPNLINSLDRNIIHPLYWKIY